MKLNVDLKSLLEGEIELRVKNIVEGETELSVMSIVEDLIEKGEVTSEQYKEKKEEIHKEVLNDSGVLRKALGEVLYQLNDEIEDIFGDTLTEILQEKYLK